jgi:hypothetical protein
LLPAHLPITDVLVLHVVYLWLAAELYGERMQWRLQRGQRGGLLRRIFRLSLPARPDLVAATTRATPSTASAAQPTALPQTGGLLHLRIPKLLPGTIVLGSRWGSFGVLQPARAGQARLRYARVHWVHRRGQSVGGRVHDDLTWPTALPAGWPDLPVSD